MNTIPLLTLQRWHDNAAHISEQARTLQKEIFGAGADLDRQHLLILATGDAVIGAEETKRELAVIIQRKNELEAAQMELAAVKGTP